MQSSIFRLFSTFITLLLLGALIVVIWLVLRNELQTTPLSVNAIGTTSQTQAAQQRGAGALINTATVHPMATVSITADATPAVDTASIAQQRLTTENSSEDLSERPTTIPTSATPPSKAATSLSPRPTATNVASFSILRPTATPTPLKAM